MKNEKMSLDAFRAMASNVQTDEAMQQIEGGNLFDCHGNSGRIGKALKEAIINKIVDALS